MFHFTKSKFKLSNIYLIFINMQEKKLHDLKSKNISYNFIIEFI